MEKNSGGSEQLLLFHAYVGLQFRMHGGKEGLGGKGGTGPEGQDWSRLFHRLSGDEDLGHGSSEVTSKVLMEVEKSPFRS